MPLMRTQIQPIPCVQRRKTSRPDSCALLIWATYFNAGDVFGDGVSVASRLQPWHRPHHLPLAVSTRRWKTVFRDGRFPGQPKREHCPTFPGSCPEAAGGTTTAPSATTEAQTVATTTTRAALLVLLASQDSSDAILCPHALELPLRISPRSSSSHSPT
jgi:hypothetical protein